ncbi:transcription elongation factor GreA [Candidatus Saccharibacteria bacterium]|nr:transcription elongation factor GreA [Candidatus Saccharibacteria bacterium]
MIKKTIDLTAAGKKALEKELEELIAERPTIAERIATARAFGDLSENEEYSSARNEQKVAEGRILEIQEILKNAKIIREGKKSKVALGATVAIKLSGRAKEFTIVGPTEANPAEGRISDASPIGSVLMGHKPGEILDFNGKKLEIVEIK